MIFARWGLAVGGVLALATGAAEASSFVAIAPPKEAISPSFVALGAPSPAVLKAAKAPISLDPALTAAVPPRSSLDAPPFLWGETVQVSPSMIVMGKPAVVVAGAQPKAHSRTHPWALPVVIRGGVVGDAAPQQAVAAAPRPEPTPASAPASSASPHPADDEDEQEDTPPEPNPTEPPPGMPILGKPE